MKYITCGSVTFYVAKEIATCFKLNDEKQLTETSLKNYTTCQQTLFLVISSNDQVVQYCICGLSVKSCCSIETLDFTLLHTLISNCCKINPDEKMWLDAIREVRNNLAHVECVSVFDQGRLQKWWDKLDGSVLGLTSKLSKFPRYEESIKSHIIIIIIIMVNTITNNCTLKLPAGLFKKEKGFLVRLFIV